MTTTSAINLNVPFISTIVLNDSNIKLDAKKVVDGIEFDLTLLFIEGEKGYSYRNVSKFEKIFYYGFRYTYVFTINLDGSIGSKTFLMENSDIIFHTESEVLNAIDKLYSIISNKYKNATNKIELTTIGKNYRNRKGDSILNRFKGKEDAFLDLIDSLLINNVTSVEEYKETMLETVYFLIQNEKASNEKDLALHHFAQRYRDIYSGK